MNSKKLLVYYVERCEKEYAPYRSRDNEKAHFAYISSINSMKNFDPAQINEKEVNEIVKPYLVKWEKVARVLKKNSDWQKRLSIIIYKYRNELSDLRKQHLEESSLLQYKDIIQNLYENMQPILKPVATVKTLHLMCPDFFPLWDNDILDGIRAECDKNDRARRQSSDDYFIFMRKIKEILREYLDTITHLSEKNKKPKLKIIDECLLWAIRRPYEVFLIR